MTVEARVRAPGVYVLGMHRSGTSVMAGVLDRLGLDGGPRESMFAADEFNSDGYWEQRPLVEMHDRLLQRLGGFASAPPTRRPLAEMQRRVPDSGEQIETFVDSLFTGPWFVKDPRHCLLLPLWTSALGDDDLAVVVLRSPDAVVRSLQRRNGYPTTIALGLWERYMIDLLSGIEGRPTLAVRYEDLVSDPRGVITDLVGVLERHVGPIPSGAIDHAVELVRDRSVLSATPTPVGSDASNHLVSVLAGVVGYHSRFALDGTLPVQSTRVRHRLARRRLSLRLVGSVVGHDAVSRSQLDRRRVGPPARSQGTASS